MSKYIKLINIKHWKNMNTKYYNKCDTYIYIYMLCDIFKWNKTNFKIQNAYIWIQVK